MTSVSVDGHGHYFSVSPVSGYWGSKSHHISELPNLFEQATEYGVTVCPTDRFMKCVNKLLESRGGLPSMLYPYQKVGSEFLWKNKIAFLFDEMGLGKTVQALTAIPDGSPAMIICPAFLKGVWAAESEQWSPGVSAYVCRKKDEFRFPNDGEIVITNYESIPDELDKFGVMGPNTVLIADEAQYVKSWKAKRTRNFRKLARRSLKSDGHVWLLSGTPILNRPNELWSLLQSVGLGKSLYRSYRHFVTKFGGYQDGLGIIRWSGVPKKNAMDPIRPFVLRRTREEVLPDLPKKTYQRVVLSIEDNRLKKKLDSFLDGRTCDDSENIIWEWKFAPDIAVARRKLAQKKLPYVKKIIEVYEQSESPVVVFGCHRQPIEDIGSRDGWAFIHGGVQHQDRQDIVNRFQEGKLKGLACTIKSSGVGLTLTRSKHAVFIDLEWSPSTNLQAEDRLCRIGQKSSVLIQRVLFDHPLDTHVANLLDKKQKTIDMTIGKLNENLEIPIEAIRKIVDQING